MFIPEFPDQGFPGLQSAWDGGVDSGETSYVGHGRLRGRKALITGGDSGIGRAVAVAFAREGADVVINYLPEEQEDADVVQELVEAAGARFFGMPGDLLNETFCTDLVHRAGDALGGLDILVSNAGFARNQFDVAQHPTDMFDRTFRTNVFASFFLVRAAVAAPGLLPPGASVIFTASSIATQHTPFLVDYSATKAALVSMTRTLGNQLAPQGIRVNAVAPGITASNFLTSQNMTREDAVDLANSTLPLRRLSQPAEMAPMYVTVAEGIDTAAIGTVFSPNGGDGGF
ncbi:hypothetical protein N3K66_001526 [Trichothecium roseum]|uniref:Uncharacterized protein n=1 Tax=Trichothecium roseum TaxID=47278 RepID=A0ACC0VF50_9HYPO|nr:hypothetical protein N3K66_001526 [Trichothecium roseum]